MPLQDAVVQGFGATLGVAAALACLFAASVLMVALAWIFRPGSEAPPGWSADVKTRDRKPPRGASPSLPMVQPPDDRPGPGIRVRRS